MPIYNYKIEYTDLVTGVMIDITDKIRLFSVSASKNSYCREMILDIVDPAFYSILVLVKIPEDVSIEIFTYVEDTWYTQGKYFIERPTLSHELNSVTSKGIWGRSKIAKLDKPFSPKKSIVLEKDTTFFALASKLVTDAGLTWDISKINIEDFPIYAYSYSNEGSYPIEILTELANYAGAFVSTDRENNFCISKIIYSPLSSHFTIIDDLVVDLNENSDWPEFGNRINIIPSGALSGYQLNVNIPNNCLQTNGVSTQVIYARVTDSDGEPVQNIPIDWEIDSEEAVLSSTTSNTKTHLMPIEEIRASNYYDLRVSFPPSSVQGVWAYADKTRSDNLADGASIEDSTITLINKLEYCDQLLVVEYYSDGVAINYVTAGTVSEDVEVTASTEGVSDSDELYIGNDCECPPSIDLEVIPTSININETALLLVYAERSGPITSGKLVYLSQTDETVLGSLSWGSATLSTVEMKHESATSKNEVSGLSQVTVSRYISSVSGVWQADSDGAATGSNLYGGAFSGKTIDLSSVIESGIALLVTYTIEGAAVASFVSSGISGTSHFKTWMSSNREAPVEDTGELRIEDTSDPYDDDYGGIGGTGSSTGGLTPSNSGYCGNDAILCAEDEQCCYGPDGNIGCFPSDDCVGGGGAACVTQSMADSEEENTATRFESALAAGCTCEELCQFELDVYGTTQDYDEASYRPISLIVEEDHGFEEGTADYNEKFAELGQTALDQCIALCDDCTGVEEMVALDGGVLTPAGSTTVSFTGGIGPFTWSVSGVAGTLASNLTTGRENVLTVTDENACGSAVITVTDQSCGGSCTIGVRMSNGEWVFKDNSCCVPGPAPENTGNGTVVIKGQYKLVLSVWTTTYYSGYQSGVADCEFCEARWPGSAIEPCLTGVTWSNDCPNDEISLNYTRSSCKQYNTAYKCYEWTCP